CQPRSSATGTLSALQTSLVSDVRRGSKIKTLKAKLEAFQRSKVGQFVKKVQDDQVPNLASLLAWGTLSALLPLVLGILALTGLVIRDPQRLDQIYNTLLALLPSGASG